MARFTRFAVADWSGAKGSSHPGIALAVCEAGTDAPTLVQPPGRHWSRTAILDWLLSQQDDLLVGFDFSFAPPFVARGAYLPGEHGLPGTAASFHAHVDALCDDPDLGAASFLERHYRRHFYFGAADGRGSNHPVPAHAVITDVAAHDRRAPPPAIVERTVKIAGAGILPVGFRVTE